MNITDKKNFSFWKKKVNLLNWTKKPKKIFYKLQNNKPMWFADGKLNLTLECIDFNIQKGLGKKTALIFINKFHNVSFYTYENLLLAVENFCLFLKSNYKINSNFRVIIHASASKESAIAMLSCARLGLCHSVVFQELNKDAIHSRIILFKPDLIITRDSDVNIKNKILINFKNKKEFDKVIVFRDSITNLKLKFYNTNELLSKKFKKNLKIKSFKSNKDLFVLFTSGSTGEPKGVMHSTGGYLLYAKYTCKNFFGINKESIVLAASDAGWINGHTYALYGPLSLGATSVILESPTLILDKFFLKKILKDIKITVLYLPVTIIRLLKSIIKNYSFKEHSISSLGSMGEPLAPTVGRWFAKIFNHKKAIVNTYFQTETGGIITAPIYDDLVIKSPHGSVGKPNHYFGLHLFDKNRKTGHGEIMIKNSWPGCMSKIINKQNLWKNYWTKDGYFKMFDIGSYKKDALYVHGRNDDVINIRGHRIGSEEIESILLKIKSIAELAAVAVKDNIEAARIVLFVVLNNQNNVKKVEKDINAKILSFFGSFALPKKIYYIPSLPKTRSGKILRRLLRDFVEKPSNNEYSNLSTILDYSTIKKIKNIIKNEKF